MLQLGVLKLGVVGSVDVGGSVVGVESVFVGSLGLVGSAGFVVSSSGFSHSRRTYRL